MLLQHWDGDPGFLVPQQVTVSSKRLLTGFRLSRHNASACTSIQEGDHGSAVTLALCFPKRGILTRARAGSPLGTGFATPEKDMTSVQKGCRMNRRDLPSTTVSPFQPLCFCSMVDGDPGFLVSQQVTVTSARLLTCFRVCRHNASARTSFQKSDHGSAVSPALCFPKRGILTRARAGSPLGTGFATAEKDMTRAL